MSIPVSCECGKQLHVSEAHAGKKGRCPACGRILTIPSVAAAYPVHGDSAPSMRQAAPTGPVVSPAAPMAPPPAAAGAGWADEAQGALRYQKIVSAPSGLRSADRLYLVLLLALVPLLIHTFGQSDDAGARLKHTMDANPQVMEKLPEEFSLDELFNALPGHRIEGAVLPRGTWMHWGMGLLSAALFLGLALFLLRSRDSRIKPLVIVGLFTGTLGILLLLGFQYVADWTQGVWVTGRGWLTLLFYVVKFIGFSYRCADDPSNGFLLSFLGFTCGVGLCEELVKALPLIWHFKKKGTLSWRGACVWGLVSGAGFGVAEGIMYSARYYNGIETGGIYWVRFVSCAGLHAIWTAAVGVTLFRNQTRIQGETGFWALMGWSVYVIAVPMVLHGAYDTLLKQGHDGWAIATAVASFAWLAYQIERAGVQERRGTLPTST